MDPANDQTVLGDFEDATLTHFEVTSRFYRRDGKFLVSTEGAAGTVEEFEVKIHLWSTPPAAVPGGVPRRTATVPAPLLGLPAPNRGRSALVSPLRRGAGSSRATSSSGPGSPRIGIPPAPSATPPDYARTSTLRPTPIGPAGPRWTCPCEACHGPAEAHVEWARARKRGEPRPDIPDLGLAIRLKEAEPTVWTRDENTGRPRRTPPLATHTQAEMCARCHSRRGLISEDYVHGASLLNTHSLSLLGRRPLLPRRPDTGGSLCLRVIPAEPHGSGGRGLHRLPRCP